MLHERILGSLTEPSEVNTNPHFFSDLFLFPLDFQRCLKIDPNCADAKTELEVAKKASIIKYKHKADDEFEDDEVKLTFGLSRDFVPGRTLHVLDCPSDSEEYRHSGNGRPCRYYNHNGCQFGKSCRYKHAPDVRSVRDEL